MDKLDPIAANRLQAFTAAAEVSDSIAAAAMADGVAVSPEARAEILEAVGPGIQYFYDLAFASGVLAAQGKPLEALGLFVDERDARTLLGPETVDDLIAQANAQLGDELDQL